MKLRLRSLETKETLKIDVPSPCSLPHLKHVLLQNLPQSSSSPQSIHLSLNAKDDLNLQSNNSPNQDEQTLTSLGIASGDLVFFTLNPNGFSSQPQLKPSLGAAQNSQTPQFKPDPAHLPDVQMEKTLDSSTQFRDVQIGETLDLGAQKDGDFESMEVENDDMECKGKSFTVPGFLRKVFTEELSGDGGRGHKLLVIAVHAVMSESGFVGFDTNSMNVSTSIEWPSGVFMMSLFYTLPALINSNSGNGVCAVVLKFQSLGKFMNVYGSLQSGSLTHWVRLNEDELVPFFNVVWANCGFPEKEIVGLNNLSGISPEREVFKFWRMVKDKLALPLLIDLCERSGMGLPPCFSRLPSDLKLKILESLSGVDLAKVSCVSSEMRYLISGDELWKQKYIEEFGYADESVERNISWKVKFVRSWRIRKQTRISSNGDRPRGIVFIRRNPLRFPWAPQIIGGGHDLLPQGVDPHQLPRFRQVPRCNLGGSSNSSLF